jgi:hypothetical protein
MRILVGQHIGVDLAEGRVGFVLDPVEGLDDVFLELRRTWISRD